jgi:hypothetical protein
LGDDVVIAGEAVASEYCKIMATIGVEIGLHKSLISRSGRALEFAKRFFLDGKDCSPISFKEFVVGRREISSLLELSRKYSWSLGTLLSVLGYGYKAKASVTKRLPKLSRRLRNIVIAWYCPKGPGFVSLVSWLGMKSLTSTYKALESKAKSLVSSIIKREFERISTLLDQLEPLVAKARELGTVRRDREHYGTAPREAGRDEPHPGTERSLPKEIVASLNETVYRNAFLDSVIKVRDLRNQLEELSPDRLEIADLEGLWSTYEEIRTEISALPLPRNIYKRPSEPVGSKALMGIVKSWYEYSKPFRATDSQSDL